MKTKAILMAGLMLAPVLTTAAWSQVKPVPPPPTGPVVQKPATPTTPPSRPSGPIVTPSPTPAPGGLVIGAPAAPPPPRVVAGAPAQVFFPQLTVTRGPANPSQMSVINVEIAGLGDAKAVHLLGFDTGCGFAKTGRLGGTGSSLFLTGVEGQGVVQGDRLGFASDPNLSYSILRDGTGFSLRRFDAVGIPVGAGGVAKFSMGGVVGTVFKFNKSAPAFDGNAVADANRRSQSAGSGYLPHLYAPESALAGSDMANNGCTATGMIMVQGADSVWRMADRNGTWKPVAEVTAPKIYTSRPFAVTRHRRVTIENTGVLKALLDPTVKTSPGLPLQSCNGESIGLAGKFPVGAIVRDGDLTFAARSGPLGTRCLFVTKPALLPPGVKIVSATWAVRQTGGKCTGFGNAIEQLAAFAANAGYQMSTAANSAAYAALTGEIPPSGAVTPLAAANDLKRQFMPARFINFEKGGTYFDLSTSGFENPFIPPVASLPGLRPTDPVRNTSRLAYDVFEPMASELNCPILPSNDHEIAMVLERVVADVPEDVRFPQ